jgi:hypothetical protein
MSISSLMVFAAAADNTHVEYYWFSMIFASRTAARRCNCSSLFAPLAAIHRRFRPDKKIIAGQAVHLIV